MFLPQHNQNQLVVVIWVHSYSTFVLSYTIFHQQGGNSKIIKRDWNTKRLLVPIFPFSPQEQCFQRFNVLDFQYLFNNIQENSLLSKIHLINAEYILLPSNPGSFWWFELRWQLSIWPKDSGMANLQSTQKPREGHSLNFSPGTGVPVHTFTQMDKLSRQLCLLNFMVHIHKANWRALVKDRFLAQCTGTWARVDISNKLPAPRLNLE